MAVFNKFNSFVEAVTEKKHDLGADVIHVTFTNAANPPIAGNAVLTDLTQIALTYIDSQVVSRVSSGQTGGIYSLVLTDKVVTAVGGPVGPFRYAVLYNNTAVSKDLIGWYDYGSEITLAAGETLTINFDTQVLTLQ